MKKRIRNLLWIFAAVCLTVGIWHFPSQAAGSARISFSDISCKVGDTFTVNMSVNATDTTLAALDAVLLYPTDALELVSCSVPSPGNYSSSGGTIIISWYDAAGTGKVNISLKFKALKAGATAVTVESQEIADVDGNVISSSAASSAITVGAESTASGDSTLSNLQISPGKLSPAFASTRTEYDIQVNNDVTKLAVSAKTNDPNAKFVVSSTDLEVGDNTITVKVTAEDGKTTTTYTIKVKRLAAPTTTTTEKETEKETETEEESTEAEEENIIVTVNGENRILVASLADVTLPEGYEAVDYEYDGHQVQAAKALSGDLLAFYLADQDGENPQFYLYNESDGTFTRMMNIQTGAKLYTVVDLDEGVIIPDTYHETTVEIEGLDIRAWQSNDDLERVYYLIYAMNWNGEKALYRYDSQEGTMQRADEGLLLAQVNAEDETEPSAEDLQALLDQAESQKEEEKGLPGWVKYVALGILAVIIILMIVLLILKNRDNGHRPGGRRLSSREDRREYRPERAQRQERDGSEARREQAAPYQKPEDGLSEQAAAVQTPNASDLSSMLNQLDSDKDDDDFEIFDL